MNMIPQAYPLWCANLSESGIIDVGRIVGWRDYGPEDDLIPVVATERWPRGGTVGIGEVSKECEWFIEETAALARSAAEEYLTVRRKVEAGETTWPEVDRAAQASHRTGATS